MERTTPALIAVLNDQEWTARSLETILEAAGYRTLRAFTAGQLLHRLESERPDAFVLDLQLPDRSGLEVAQLLRADPRFGPATPIIVTTAGPSGRQARLDAHAAGAWDFLGQPLDGEALLAKLRIYVAAHRAARAGRDPETGLYAQPQLVERVRELAAAAQRRAGSLACVALGVPVSDGGPASERAVAEMVASNCRGSDVAGRLAPGQFAVIAVDADRHGADRLAHRLVQGLEGLGLAAGHRLGVTALGLEGLENGDLLLASASAALAA